MNGQFRSALALSLAIVLASLIASSAFLKAKRLDQTIKVTGSAKRRIKSDLMVWRTSVSAEAATLADAYSRLTRDVEKTKAFLVAQGFPENQIVVSAVTTTPIRSSARGVQKFQAAPEEGGSVRSGHSAAAPAVFGARCSLLGGPTQTVLAFMNSRMPASVQGHPAYQSGDSSRIQ